MAKIKKADRLFEIFAGEFVNIIINQYVEQSVTDGETVQSMSSPLTVQGYLTDEDEIYLYLGHSPELYHQAIKKDVIIHVELSEEKNPLDDLIEQIEAPDKKEGYN